MNFAPPSVRARAFSDMLAGLGVALDDEIEVPYVVDCWIAKRRAA